MKEPDSLEKRLLSWRPRRPSSGLNRRIFGRPARIFPKTAWILGSLAPATACTLIAFLTLNRENSANPLNHESMIAMLSSNHDYGEYELAGFSKGENNWSSVTFDWTNRSGFTSSIAPFLRESPH